MALALGYLGSGRDADTHIGGQRHSDGGWLPLLLETRARRPIGARRCSMPVEQAGRLAHCRTGVKWHCDTAHTRRTAGLTERRDRANATDGQSDGESVALGASDSLTLRGRADGRARSHCLTSRISTGILIYERPFLASTLGWPQCHSETFSFLDPPLSCCENAAPPHLSGCNSGTVLHVTTRAL